MPNIFIITKKEEGEKLKYEGNIHNYPFWTYNLKIGTSTIWCMATSHGRQFIYTHTRTQRLFECFFFSYIEIGPWRCDHEKMTSDTFKFLDVANPVVPQA
jgi:hypothetical protein